ADLLHRVNTVVLGVPPLRERKRDIESLAGHFARAASERWQRPARALSPEALCVLCDYRFPGNVRELRNVMDYAVICADGETVQPRDLPDRVRYRVELDAGSTQAPGETKELDVFRGSRGTELTRDADQFHDRVRRYEVQLIEEGLR